MGGKGERRDGRVAFLGQRVKVKRRVKRTEGDRDLGNGKVKGKRGRLGGEKL